MYRLIGILLVFAATGVGLAQDRMVFEIVDITGQVVKPEITIFITRQNLNTDYELDLRESFIPRIVESVNGNPF